jgi:putative addiction module component (TIGR02574 family)
MNTTVIRQKLHTYLEVATDKKVKAIYTIIAKEVEDNTVEYTNELKGELDKRYADYKNGKSKTVTAEESKKRIQKILKANRKK